MDFKQLEVFVKLYELKSFTNVAKELDVSQPTVTLHIKQLEEELDTSLLIRSTRDIKYTPNATKLYNLAKIILKQREDLIRQIKNNPQNNLMLGVSTIPAAYILPKLLDLAKKEEFSFSIKASEANSKEIINKVADSEVDLGIVGMKDDNDRCIFMELVKDDFLFIAPPTEYYINLRDSSPTMKMLASEPLIFREAGSGVRKTTEDILKSGGVDPEEIVPVAELSSVEAIKQLVMKGIGTSIISSLTVQSEIDKGEIVGIPIDVKYHTRSLYLVWNKNRYQNDSMQKVITLLTDNFTIK